MYYVISMETFKDEIGQFLPNGALNKNCQKIKISTYYHTTTFTLKICPKSVKFWRKSNEMRQFN